MVLTSCPTFFQNLGQSSWWVDSLPMLEWLATDLDMPLILDEKYKIKPNRLRVIP